MALRSYFVTPTSEPHLTTPDEVLEANGGFKDSKAPYPNGFPVWAFKHFPKRAFSFLAHIFNEVLRTHNFLPAWKNSRVIATHKQGKDPALSSSCRPISLLDTIRELFEKILLARFLNVSERGLMRSEQFGFRPRHSTSLHLARIVERITRNFGDKRLTGTFSLDVAIAFDTVWINGLLRKLTLLNFPSYIVYAMSSYLRGRTFEASFQTATTYSRVMRAAVAQGGFFPLSSSVCMSTTCLHSRTTSSWPSTRTTRPP